MDETDLTTAQSYRMDRIEAIQNEMELEQETRHALINKYNKRCAVVDMIQHGLVVGILGFGTTSLGAFSTVVGSQIAIAMDIGAVTAELFLIASSPFDKYFKTNIEKHNKIKMLAEAKLANISSYVSKAIDDDLITDEEYSLILSEYKEYIAMKEQIRVKTDQKAEAGNK